MPVPAVIVDYDARWPVRARRMLARLRAHPDEAVGFAERKRALARAYADKPDYDDYTRAKSAYFDEIEPRMRAWADSSGARLE